MTFNSEGDLQAAIHRDPGLILQGIPDIDPELCEDSPQLLSLGREVRLDSGGRIDNLFIDANGILTFVECKPYDDPNKDLKRNVYPQALNYAASLAAQLADFDGQEFLDEFSKVVLGRKRAGYASLEEVVERLADDEIFKGKDLGEWRGQFPNRLERNVKQGLCRIVILCAPTRKVQFHYSAVRNLMQTMTFSEASGARYELILMELRDTPHNSTRIIWRRHAALPRIPLVARVSRDTTEGIDAMRELEKSLSESQRQRLDDLIVALENEGIVSSADTRGYALISEETGKSLYFVLKINDLGWEIVRSQINEGEKLYDTVKNSDDNSLTEWLGVACQKEQKDKSKNQFIVTIRPGSSGERLLVDAIKKLRRRPEAESPSS